MRPLAESTHEEVATQGYSGTAYVLRKGNEAYGPDYACNGFDRLYKQERAKFGDLTATQPEHEVHASLRIIVMDVVTNGHAIRKLKSFVNESGVSQKASSMETPAHLCWQRGVPSLY